MTSRFLSELLILLMLLISCSRFLYIRKVQSDSIAIVPSIALLLSVLNVFAWGFSVMEAGILALSFFVFVWNFRALLRFLSHLVIDHFGFWSILISIINLVLTVCALVFLIYMRPAYININRYNVQKTSENYTGTFESGFEPRTTPFQGRSAEFTVYSQKPEKNTEQETVETTATIKPEEEMADIIIFLPSKTAAPETYRPSLIKLAHDGYKVYTGQFFAKDMKWFNSGNDFYVIRQHAFMAMKARNQSQYIEFCEKNTENYEKELLALYHYADIPEGTRVFLAGDEDSALALQSLYEKHPDLFYGYYDLATTLDYSTPGYGPVEQTEPLEAVQLGYKRDNSLYMSSHIAQALEYSINDWKAAGYFSESNADSEVNADETDELDETEINAENAVNKIIGL